jgi:hypothetical protein
MTVYAQGLLTTFQLEGVRFTLDNASRRRLMTISTIPILAVVALVASSWLTVAIGRPAFGASEAMLRGQMAAGGAAAVLVPLSLAVLIGAGFLDLTDPERMWVLALACGAALIALGFAVTVVVMSLGLRQNLALQFYAYNWAGLGADLGLIAAGYAYCARPRRGSASRRRA